MQKLLPCKLLKQLFPGTGVPLSNQWSKDGYFYAVQIAQYGLSHYSKNLAEKSTKLKVLENGEDGLQVGFFFLFLPSFFCFGRH